LSRSEIEEILTKLKTIAVIGLSRDSNKASHRVSAYLKAHDFHIIPINPSADEILGEKSYKSLLDIPADVQKTIEVVDIFRPTEDVPSIVDQAIKLKRLHGTLQVVWMQLGIANKEAAEAAKRAKLTVIMNKCMMVEHSHLFSG